MGKRIKKRNKSKRLCVTVDLGMERDCQIEMPEGCGLKVGKAHGVGARSEQQDSFGISEVSGDEVLEKGVLAVLADGMGGMSAGEKASMAAVISCLNYFETHDMKKDAVSGLKAMAKNANLEVREVLGAGGGSSGSTLVAAFIRKKKMYWISVGDSRLFLFRDGELLQLSRDHNYAAVLQKKVEAGEMTEQEALEEPQRNALTSYIGIDVLEEIDYGKEGIALFEGDRILLMSDGIYNTLTEEEIVDAMEYTVGRSMVYIEMQVKSKRKKNQDNYTVIVLEID